MKTLNKIFTASALGISLVACGGGGSDSGSGTDPVSGSNACNQIFTPDDVYIVDLSQNSSSGVACTMTSEREEVASCVEERIRAAFADAPSCLAAFDVFVPGTNQEDGNHQQFSHIINPMPGRAYLSVQYSDAPSLDNIINYDMSVTEASTALDDLLYTLKVRFSTTDVRVFGHSKGSDAVARVSTYPEHSEIDFYAFAQAGRTPDTIRGVPGYIHKLTDNLVGITWQNDEVKYFTGGNTGYQAPEIWGFPGYINEEGGGLTVYPSRIDHHDTYGGEFTREAFPYCATGNKAAMTTAECKKQNGVHFAPYFWGDIECTEKTFDMMANAPVGDMHYIGYSGPRSGDCKDTVGTVQATYELVYRMNIADQDDCKYNMELSFNGLDSGHNRADGSRISVSSTRDTSWIRRTGTISLPYHMALHVNADMQDVSPWNRKCINYVGAKSEGYIDKLKVTFTHPGTGKQVTRTLIGNAEGIEYLWPQKVTGKNNVAWRKSSGSWDLHYGIPPTDPSHGGALMVKGTTGGGYSGRFYKWVHLID